MFKVKFIKNINENLTLFAVLIFIGVLLLSLYLFLRPKSLITGLGAIPGDVNSDGVVDIIDFQLLSNSFGKTSGQSGYNVNADFNHDNVVDILDFQVLSNNFGHTGTTTVTPTLRITATATPRITTGPTPTPGGTAYRPFTNDSYWNTKMPANAPIDPNNAKYIADAKNTAVSIPYFHLAGAPDHAAGDDWAYPVYWATTADHWYHIVPTSGGPIMDMRIPKGAKPQAGSDGGLIVFDRPDDWVKELYHGVYNSSTDTWSAASTKRYRLSSNGLIGNAFGSNEPLNAGNRGVPSSIRPIRRDEIRAGVIARRHECFWHATAEAHYWPLTSHETGKNGVAPEGLVIRLKPGVNISNRGLSFTELIIAKMMQDYGCIIGDNEGGAGNTLKLERGKAEWYALDPNLNYNALSVFTWDDYEFIKGGYNPVTGTIVQ